MSSPSRRLLAAAVLLSLMLLPAASLGAPAAIKAIDSDTGWEFSPAKKRVGKGTVVAFKGKSATVHEIKFYKGPLKDRPAFELAPDQVVKKRMKKVGVHKYRCLIEPHSSLQDGVCTGMCGQIKVVSS